MTSSSWMGIMLPIASLGWQLFAALAGPAVMLWLAWRVRGIAPLWISWLSATSAIASLLARIPMLAFHPLVRQATGWDPVSNYATSVFPVVSALGTLAWLLFLVALIGLTNTLCRTRRELDVMRSLQTR